MKNYPHLIARLLYEPLLLTPKKHAVLCSVIESALAGDGPRALPLEEAAPKEPLPAANYNHIAIIPVHGTIGRHTADFMSGGCGLDDVHAQMDLAEYDPDVEQVLFDFRTPGGEVTGVPELARRIAEFPKPTIGYSESESCSAGMWLMSQCRLAYATPSATLGSIGEWTA